MQSQQSLFKAFFCAGSSSISSQLNAERNYAKDLAQLLLLGMQLAAALHDLFLKFRGQAAFMAAYMKAILSACMRRDQRLLAFRNASRKECCRDCSPLSCHAWTERWHCR